MHDYLTSRYELIRENAISYEYQTFSRTRLFDKYQYISAKDNERIWRASEVVIDFDLSIVGHLEANPINENLPV